MGITQQSMWKTWQNMWILAPLIFSQAQDIDSYQLSYPHFHITQHYVAFDLRRKIRYTSETRDFILRDIVARQAHLWARISNTCANICYNAASPVSYCTLLFLAIYGHTYSLAINLVGPIRDSKNILVYNCLPVNGGEQFILVRAVHLRVNCAQPVC